MKPDEYLNAILKEQTFGNDDKEIKDLRQRRKDVQKCLETYFSNSTPAIRWAGSMAKGTMIRESYDGDVTCYFPHDEEEAGKTLEEIYRNAKAALADAYQVEEKASALRIKSKEDFRTDLHLDVVPGRFTSDDKDDVYLHRTSGDKERLKTNLQVHIDHIKDSGVTDAIRLTKLWRVLNGVTSAKTFVLELLVVNLLAEKKASKLVEQLLHVWTEFRDNPDALAVQDPANSNNDLKPMLDECRGMLSSVASNTLWQIEHNGWEAVFGNVKADQADRSATKAALITAAGQVSNPTKPWLQD